MSLPTQELAAAERAELLRLRAEKDGIKAWRAKVEGILEQCVKERDAAVERLEAQEQATAQLIAERDAAVGQLEALQQATAELRKQATNERRMKVEAREALEEERSKGERRFPAGPQPKRFGSARGLTLGPPLRTSEAQDENDNVGISHSFVWISSGHQARIASKSTVF